MSLVVAHDSPEHINWQATLNALPVRDVEDALRRTEFRLGEQLSILDYLTSPGENRTQAEALKDVLEKLGDKSEDIAVTTSLVWRYAQAKELWATHANPNLRNPEAFLANLTNNQVVKLNIVFGTSTTRARRNSIRVIEEHWGPTWFESIPAQIRPPLKTPAEAPKRLLIEIAATCKKGTTIQRAISAWEEAIDIRTDDDRRREAHSRASRAPYLTTSDVAQWNKSARIDNVGRRPVELYIPELHEDRIELKGLQPTQSTTERGTSKRGRGKDGKGKGGTKRPRVRLGQPADDTADVDPPQDSQESEPPQSAQPPQMPRCYSNLIVWHVSALLALEHDRNTACCDSCEEAAEGIVGPLRRHGVQAMLDSLAETEVHYIDDEIISPAPEPQFKRATTLS